MTNRMSNPLESLFSNEEPSDEQIAASLQSEEEVEEETEVDEEVEEVATKPDEEKSDESDDDEDDESVPDTVPKSALLKERDKWRKRLARAEGREEAFREVSTRQPAKADDKKVESEFVIPDPKEDLEGYTQYHEKRTQLLLLNERMNNSERWAVKEHGKETVDKAFAWWSEAIKSDPSLDAKVRGHADPYEECVKLYKQNLRTSKLKDVPDEEFDEFQSWKKARKEGKLADWEASKKGKDAKSNPKSEAAPTKGKKAAPAPVEEDDEETDDEMPPSSLASEQSARGKDSDKIGVGNGKAFDNLFR